jgi:imidazolonepropionase-like amidohydrolase
MTGTGDVIENGALLIQGGKIQDLGVNVEVDFGTAEADLGPGTIVPGLIDAHSSLFILPGELDAPGSPAWDVRDALDPFDDDYEEALAQGVTTVYVSPGNRSRLGGRGAVLKLKRDPGQRLLRRDAALQLSLGMSDGLRSSSLDRLNDYYALRDAFLGAQEYVRQLEYYEEDLTTYTRKQQEQAKIPEAQREKLTKPPRPQPNPDQEVLRRALQGDLPVRIEAHRPDDLLNAIRLVEEFRLKVVLEGCTEAYRVTDEIARRDMPVILRPTAPPGEPRLEFQHFRADNAAVLAAAGVRLAFGTMDPNRRATRFLRLQAAEAVGHGLDRAVALRAITSTAAELLGVADRVGSLAKGKDADLVVFNGDPLDARARVEKVMIEGQWVLERGQ